MNKIFLRDASVLFKKIEKNYTDNLKRTTKAMNISSKLGICSQITINKSYFLKNFEKFEKVILNSKKISKFTIHLTAHYEDLFSDDENTKNFVNILNKIIKKSKKIIGICVHPDHLNSWKYLKKLNNKGNYLAIEVTDKKAKYGNKIDHIRKILSKHSYLKLVIDTSHIKELNQFKIMNFENFYKEFKKKIVEAQISDYGNFYKNKKIKTTHSLLCLEKDKKLQRQIKILSENKKDLNLVIEGLMPFGQSGNKLLKDEIKYIRKIIN
jgi:hypothetical protein